ncbi:efflux RND transporter periplasmic adaptor subunit [Paraglaciecola polaris]|uniref:AcrA/E family efflux transporter MFP subunit n=1 Tax=Paraglaciecola polaris LMG 21857 TaxID=1129793 RepID=K6ZDK3_9ALTE|nr:efflux RND transporter periplasmic adaptor subunit [Paraglaciecola polaris]GAC34176.1 AcrA/E family efflux transporter MFP subunit [Paraglaciecola polaris LMG 21857]
MKKSVPVLALGILASGFLLTACNESAKSPEEIVRPIAWTEVKPHALTQVRRLAGTTAAVEKAALSFLVGGKVASVSVNLGQKITLGQVLATLDQRSFVLNHQSAQAKYAQASSALNEAQNEYQRYKELVEQGLVSKSGFDNAEAAYKSALSNVEVAKSQLELATKDRQDSTLQAPYDGVITKRMIEPSQQISPGQSVFEVEGHGGLEVQVSVPESLIQQLSDGMTVPVRFPAAPYVELTGVITEVGTRAEAANAFPITLVLNGSSPLLRAGMTAEVDITYTSRADAQANETNLVSTEMMIIPVSALAAGQDQTKYVFVYDPDSQTVSKRDVLANNILGNEVYIAKGLQAGEIIAIAGVSFLRNGQHVTLLDANVKRFN